MGCDFSKKGVPRQQVDARHGGIRASKFYGVNDQPQTVTKHGYAPVKQSSVRGTQRHTRPQNYAIEESRGSRSKLIAGIKQLDFRLDQDPGVANTFDVPTFDYHTMLSHNIYSNLNSRIRLPMEDDGYRNSQIENRRSGSLVRA